MSNYDNEPDETIMERITGLTEILPSSVRNAGGKIISGVSNFVKKSYSFACNATWICFTGILLIISPIIFELERTNLRALNCGIQKDMPGICNKPGNKLK